MICFMISIYMYTQMIYDIWYNIPIYIQTIYGVYMYMIYDVYIYDIWYIYIHIYIYIYIWYMICDMWYMIHDDMIHDRS